MRLFEIRMVFLQIVDFIGGRDSQLIYKAYIQSAVAALSHLKSRDQVEDTL